MHEFSIFRFGSTYIGSYMSLETKVSTSKTQHNWEHANVNRMWQLGNIGSPRYSRGLVFVVLTICGTKNTVVVFAGRNFSLL